MNKNTFLKKMGSFGKGVVDKVSNVMAAPAKAKAAYTVSKSGLTADVLRQANASKGAPQTDSSGKLTDAFKTRATAEGIKAKMKK